MNHSTDVNFDPGTKNALACAWPRVKANFWLFFLVQLIITLLDSPFQRVLSELSENYASIVTGFLSFAYSLLFFTVIHFGSALIFLRGVRGDEVKFIHIFEGFHNYINVVLASLLGFGLVAISFIFFVIPGIYVLSRLIFLPYLVMDEGLAPIEAIEASWRMTRGHVPKLLGLGFTTVLLVITGILLLVLIFGADSYQHYWILSSIPVVMWTKASLAALYLSITQQSSYQPENMIDQS